MSDFAALSDEPSASATPSTSNPVSEKPVVVRVKRKSFQSRLDAFWLEINGRPLKRQLLDFANLSISDADTGKVLEEFGTKKLLVQHLETVRASEDIKDMLQCYLHDSSYSKELKRMPEERGSIFKPDKKQDQLRSVALKKHERLLRNCYRILLEMLDMNKYGRAEGDVQMQQKRVYVKYVVCMTLFELTLSMKLMKGCISPMESCVHECSFISVDDGAILCNYLPLIKEYLPETAVEIESGIRESREDNYVYDLYTVGDGLVTTTGDTTKYPLVQVNDDDDGFYEGPMESDCETDDSNAECNPRNDYPDEESSRDEAEGEDRDDFFDDLERSDSDSQPDEADVDEEDEEVDSDDKADSDKKDGKD
ncbi:hypothetical protein MUK42_12498 [Musa troglodytarum]|uniref:Transcription factor Iwr1 domain-containing protein n=1 Tax=Musa troglodytarum TaxID=320322 RepID=A0A9E7GV45_9LILI|nr:hypothetical protein MUK42_12498 [Musa troglodytarum]